MNVTNNIITCGFELCLKPAGRLFLSFDWTGSREASIGPKVAAG